MRARILATSLVLLASAGCYAVVATTPAARTQQTLQPPTTAAPVDVAGKVVEQGPSKQRAVDADLARTGAHTATYVLVGLGLTGIGLVLLDQTDTSVPARALPPRREAIGNTRRAFTRR